MGQDRSVDGTGQRSVRGRGHPPRRRNETTSMLDSKTVTCAKIYEKVNRYRRERRSSERNLRICICLPVYCLLSVSLLVLSRPPRWPSG